MADYAHPGTFDTSLFGEPPKEPHLGVITDDAGSCLSIPVGARVLIIENPAQYNGIFPLTLVRVSRKELVLKCACRQPNCTRKVNFKATWKGIHPQSERSKAEGV